jgi:mevalonate kinase
VTSRSMETTVFGKAILAGEHAVIRGFPAIVFPVPARALRLRYTDSAGHLTVSFAGDHGDELKLLFWGVIERACEMTGLHRDSIRGHFEIENTIPVGAGMGASGALSVAVGRWFESQGQVSASELHEFCRQLENLFHGESSGLDVAIAISGQGLRFVRDGDRSRVVVAWKPQWFVSFSGQRGLTAECVARVKALHERDPELGRRIDEQMRDAVMVAEAALMKFDTGSFGELAAAIELACSCFVQWGLVNGEIGSHMQMLRSRGAAAVKPTGSGDGGFVLSLWKNAPPADLMSQLISLNPN